jgi:hypothetical protein
MFSCSNIKLSAHTHIRRSYLQKLNHQHSSKCLNIEIIFFFYYDEDMCFAICCTLYFNGIHKQYVVSLLKPWIQQFKEVNFLYCFSQSDIWFILRSVGTQLTRLVRWGGISFLSKTIDVYITLCILYHVEDCWKIFTNRNPERFFVWSS